MEQQSQQNLFPSTPPKNWLVESILVTIFCCLPFGIVGIVNASQVNSRFSAGDHEGAMNSSKEAGKWTKVGFFIGIGLLAVYLLGLVFGYSTFTFTTKGM